jgi:transcriptional regulator with XRE-family HTH domain
MSNLATNLKYLRKKKGYTQQQLADILGIKRSLVGAYEEYRAEPKYDLLTRMANLFGLSMDELINDTINERWKPKTSADGSSVRVLSITVDKEDNEIIQLVPVKASAGYLNGYADPEYIEELPQFSLPMFSNGTYRAFELKGDSMLPLDSGTIIVGQYLEDWKSFKLGETYVVVSKSEGVVYKRLTNRLHPVKGLKLVSDNQEYEPYYIPQDDILEIWKAKAFISTKFPDPKNGPTLDEITSMMSDMAKTIQNFQRKGF